MSTTGMIDMVARRTTASRRIQASPEQIFDVLADPSKHALFDGSDTVSYTHLTLPTIYSV